MPSLNNVLDWDRYSYVRNNALNYNDPSGHLLCSPFRPCEPVTLTDPPKTTNDKMGLPDVTITSGKPPYNPTVTPRIEDMVYTSQGWEPFITPTPYPYYKGNPNQPQPMTSGTNFYLETSEVDGVDFVIDLIGLGADVVGLIFPAILLQADAIGGFVELIGAGKTIYEIIEGDPEAVQDISLDLIWNTIEENPIVKVRLGRVAPVLGILGNLYSLYANISPAIKPTEH